MASYVDFTREFLLILQTTPKSEFGCSFIGLEISFKLGFSLLLSDNWEAALAHDVSHR